MNVFEYATRNKLRFQVTEKGVLSVEDLWTLSLERLDKVVVDLYNLNNSTNKISFLHTVTKENTENELKFELAKYILDVRKEELNQRKLQAETKQQIQMLLELKAKKQQESLENLPMEQIDAEIEKLKQSI